LAHILRIDFLWSTLLKFLPLHQLSLLKFILDGDRLVANANITVQVVDDGVDNRVDVAVVGKADGNNGIPQASYFHSSILPR